MSGRLGKRKRGLIVMLASILGVVGNLACYDLWLQFVGMHDGKPHSQGFEPQCGHWVLSNACKLFGHTLPVAEAIKQLGSSQTGHSFHDLTTAFAANGIAAHGVRLNAEEIPTVQLPAVVHLRDPDHFMVLTKIEEGRVSLVDIHSQRLRVPFAVFLQRFSGNVLVLSRSATFQPNSERLPVSEHPLLFDSLVCDLGTVDVQSGLIFSFPVKNRSERTITLRVAPGCGCLKPAQVEMSVPAGQTAKVVFDYVDAGRETDDLIAQTAEVFVEGQSRSLKLEMRAIVKSRLAASPRALRFGLVSQSSIAQSRHILLRSLAEPDWRLTSIRSGHECVEVQECPWSETLLNSIWPGIDAPNLDPASLKVLEVKLLPDRAKSPTEEINCEIVAETTLDGGRRIVIPVSASIGPVIKVIPAQPRIQLESATIHEVVFIHAMGKGIEFQSFDSTLLQAVPFEGRATPKVKAMERIQFKVSPEISAPSSIDELTGVLRFKEIDSGTSIEVPLRVMIDREQTSQSVP